MTTPALTTKRNELADALSGCDRGAFPGSRAWRAEGEALKALAAFDAAHPDVIARIKSDHDSQVLANKDSGGL